MKTSYLSLVPIAALASACADTDVEIDGSTITDSKRSEIVTNMPSRDNSVSSAYMGLSAYFPNATALDYYWIGDFGYYRHHDYDGCAGRGHECLLRQ